MYVDVLFKLQISIGTKLALEGNFHTQPKQNIFDYVTAYVTNDWYLGCITIFFSMYFYYKCEYNTNIFSYNYCNTLD